MSLDEQVARIKEGIAQNTLPGKLYKYRQINDLTFEILRASKIWFAKAESFNDPFDCNLSETFDHTKSDLEEYLAATGSHLTDAGKVAILKKFDSEPSAIRDICIKARSGAINSRGVLCLSKNYDNILMWSHYADYHKGLVLGFDVLKHPEFFANIFPVHYVETYTELNYYRNRNETVTKNISTKAKLWEYEQEVRLNNNRHGLWDFNRTCLDSIYFGCRTSSDDIDKVRILCEDSGLTHINFYKSKMAHGAFELEFSPIS